MLLATEVSCWASVSQARILKINLGLLLHLLKKRLFLSVVVANPVRHVSGTSRAHLPHLNESICLRTMPTEKRAEVETQISYNTVRAARYIHA